jgi:hypothetical protein
MDRPVTGHCKEFGIPGTLLSVLELTVQNTLACDKIVTELGHFFKVIHGLKQGDGDDPSPFEPNIETCHQTVVY